MTDVHAADFDRLVAYYSGDLSPAEETALEDHWVACAECAADAANLATLVGSVTDLAARGFGLWAITPELLARFRDRGLRIHEERAAPGGALHIGSTRDIDLLIARLSGDFAGVDTVDVTFDTLDGPLVETGVPVTSDSEVVIACVLHLRAAPGTEIRSKCTIAAGGRVLGEYRLGIDVSPSA